MASEQLFESLTCSCVPGGPQGTLSRPREAMVGTCTCMGSVDTHKAARAPCRAVPCRQALNKYYGMNMLIAETHPAALTHEERERELRIHLLFCKFCLLKATVWFGVRSLCSGVGSFRFSMQPGHRAAGQAWANTCCRSACYNLYELIFYI